MRSWGVLALALASAPLRADGDEGKNVAYGKVDEATVRVFAIGTVGVEDMTIERRGEVRD
jgi:hypothetical protein